MSIIEADIAGHLLAPTRHAAYLSAEQCDAIIHHAEQQVVRPGRMYVPREGARRCMQAEINATGPLSWMRDSIDALVARVNVQYQLDLTPESRRFVYIRYDQDGLIDWHSDYDFQTQHPRKISVTVQLSAPQTYTGGALEFHPYGELPMSKIQGTAVVFPSWVVHRACAVSSGVRRALVAWYSGPHLR